MRKVLSLALVCAFAMFSCSKSDDSGDSSSPSFSFSNQNAQGKIEGVAFNVEAARANASTFGNDSTFLIELYGDTATEPCLINGFGMDMVFMHLPMEVGLYELSFSTTGTSRTVTLYDTESSTNVISTDGAVEILEITDNVIKGRIDARYDGDNNVNGNFEARRCL